MTKKQTFDAAQIVTDQLIKIIERGVLPWRQPWKGGPALSPLRHCGTAYQGVNCFLLTMQQMMQGYTTPYWMTFQQAKQLGGQVRKGEKSTIVVYYGTTEKEQDGTGDTKIIHFLKSYRVFNADQIDGLDAGFHPASPQDDRAATPSNAPIPEMQAFFEAIDANVSFTGTEAYYMPAVDKIYLPDISRFDDARDFYSIWGHELGHWTKAVGRLSRDYGSDKRFGGTAYAREEVTVEIAAVMLGQHLGYAPHTIERSASYLNNWLSVLRADKTAIFKHAADAQKICDYLIARSEAGQGADMQAAA